MSTDIRPEISKKSKWWISKHRYYELKHFCLQYREFRELYLSAINKREGEPIGAELEWQDPVGMTAVKRLECKEKMDKIERCAYAASDELGSYILKAATEGASYTCLKMMHDIPCSKSTFYDLYRKFFFILSRT